MLTLVGSHLTKLLRNVKSPACVKQPQEFPEFHLWAVTSWEQQRSEGPGPDTASQGWFGFFLSHRQTVTLTCIVFVPLNGTSAIQEAAQRQLLHSNKRAERLDQLSKAHKRILHCCWEKSYQSQNVCTDGEKFRSPVTHRHMQGWIIWRGWVIRWQAAFKILNRDIRGLKVIAFIGIPNWALCVAGVVERSAEGWMLLWVNMNLGWK